jgi:hypothetical protein
MTGGGGVFFFFFLGTGPLHALMHSSYVQGTISMCSAGELYIGSRPVP